MASSKKSFDPTLLVGKPTTAALRNPAGAQDGQVPVWNNTTKKWDAANGESSFQIRNEYFVGDGVLTLFNSTQAIQHLIFVEIGGVIQRLGNDYNVVDTNILFNDPPPVGLSIGFCYVAGSAITYLESEGNILLDVPRHYAGPITGDLFVDVAGASENVVSTVDHNDIFEPVISSSVVCNLIAGVYVAGVANRILIRCNKASGIVTSIEYLFYQP